MRRRDPQGEQRRGEFGERQNRNDKQVRGVREFAVLTITVGGDGVSMLS